MTVNGGVSAVNAIPLAQKDFRLAGRSFRKSRRDFVDATSGQRPRAIQTWAVDLDGVIFPSKQAVALAVGFNDFTTQQANTVLRRFGFEPFVVAAERDADGARPIVLDRASFDARAVALAEAVRFMAPRPDATIEDVLRVAERFESWLLR